MIWSKVIYILFCVGVMAMMVYFFYRLVNYLGTKKGDFELLKNNAFILLPIATLLIFAFVFAISLYFYTMIFGSPMQ